MMHTMIQYIARSKQMLVLVLFLDLGLILYSSLGTTRKATEVEVWEVTEHFIILTGASWEAGKMTVLRFYRCLIHSWRDYGSFLCATAFKRILAKLNPIHSCAKCLFTGAFRRSKSGKSVHRIRRVWCKTSLSFIHL
jgi:hypothetical protein